MSQSKLGNLDVVLSMDTKDFNKALRETQDGIKDQKKEFKLLDAEMKNVEKTEEELTKATKKLEDALEKQEQAVKDLDNALERQVATYGKNSREAKRATDNLRDMKITVEQTKTKLNSLNRELEQTKAPELDTGGVSSFGDALGDIGDIDFGNLGGSLGGIAGRLGGMAGLAGGVATAFVGIGIAGSEAYETMKKSMSNISTYVGGTRDEIKNLEDNFRKLKTSVVFSDEDLATQAMNATIKYTSDGDNEVATAQAEQLLYLIQKIQGDTETTIQTIDMLMETQGMSFEESANYILTSGMNVEASTDDILESIREYFPVFSELGYTVDDFFQLMYNGSKNGVLNIDGLADAHKEMSVRMTDDTKDYREALAKTDQATQNSFKQFKDGKVTHEEYTRQILLWAKDEEDALKRKEVLHALVGTKAEDLNQKALTSYSDKIDKEKLHQTTIQEGIKNLEDTEGAWSAFKRWGVGALDSVISRFGDLNREIMDFYNNPQFGNFSVSFNGGKKNKPKAIYSDSGGTIYQPRIAPRASVMPMSEVAPLGDVSMATPMSAIGGVEQAYVGGKQKSSNAVGQMYQDMGNLKSQQEKTNAILERLLDAQKTTTISVDVPLVVDGKLIARATAPHMNKEIGTIDKRKNRLGGF